MWTLSVCSGMLFFTACGDSNKEVTSDRQELSQTENAAALSTASPELKHTSTAELGNHTYRITIHRKSDSTLPKVKDEFNKEFNDNRVHVIVERDGSEIFNKDFTKATFNDNLTDEEQPGTILLGMAFDQEKSDGHTICLGAQIGLVGIEEGPAFCVKISTDGKGYTIVRDHNQDTTGDDGMGEE